jgi:hypothetical protein
MTLPQLLWKTLWRSHTYVLQLSYAATLPAKCTRQRHLLIPFLISNLHP